MCKINPRVDFAFKKLFGSEENKDLLISLINAIVSQQDQVVELELKNPYNLADYQAGKMSILDIKAKAENGQWFNVEIQSALDRWSSFLTTAHQLDREHTPKELASDKNIVKAIAAIDRMFNEEERKVYEVRLQEFTDVASIIASGAEKNIAKGVEIGMEIGMEKGVEIGMEKGAVIGRVGGVVEGQSKLLKRLLERRFGTLPQWATEKLSSASEHELESWGDSILSAPTLEAVFNQI